MQASSSRENLEPRLSATSSALPGSSSRDNLESRPSNGSGRFGNSPKAKNASGRKPGPDLPRAEVVPAGAIQVREPTLDDPDTAAPASRRRRWSSEPPSGLDIALACCCPCVILGLSWRDAGLGRFWHGCLPLGLVAVTLSIITMLPYLDGGGDCSYPAVRFETDVIAGFFTGKCSTMEYVTLPFARIFYCIAVALLYYSRRRLAAKLGIHEKPCPTLCCQCCCCYACLLATELRTVREEMEREASAPKSAPVGQAVMVRTTV